MIKKWVEVFTGDLAIMYNRLSLACEKQKSMISHRYAFDSSTHLERLSSNLWTSVVRKISHHTITNDTIRTILTCK